MTTDTTSRTDAPSTNTASTSSSCTDQNGFSMTTESTESISPDPITTAAAPAGKPGWPAVAVRALHKLNTARTTVATFVRTDTDGAARLLGAVLASLVSLVVLISVVARLVSWLGYGDPAHDLAQWLPVLRLATDPIQAWMVGHTAGLPIAASTAVTAWGVTGLVLLYTASCHHLGAQLMWIGYGVATAAMVWGGTATPDHRPITVGVLAIAWAALSLIALRRRPRPLPVFPPS